MTVRSLKPRALRALVALALTAAALMTALCVGASASSLYGFQRSFGSFGNVEDLAVDQSTGDVYVYDTAEGGAVYRFDASGQPVEFSSTGSNAISGVGATPRESQLAVDSSTGVTKGDIYVATSYNVRIYGPDGKSLGELNGGVSSEVPGAPWDEPCGVAVDPKGQVYVGLWGPGGSGSHVNRYTPGAESPVANKDYSGSLSGLDEVCAVAADGEGSVYAVTWPNGPVYKYDALQFGSLQAQGTPLASEGHTPTVAAGDLYLDTGSKVMLFNPEGDPAGSLSSPSQPESSFARSNGAAANGSTGELYVSDNEHGRIVAFDVAGVLPDAVTRQPAFKGETVILKGTVNPNGLEASCRFEYGPGPSTFDHVVPCTPEPGSGSSPVPVSAEVGGLRPGALYYYRVVAENEYGANAAPPVGFYPQVPNVRREWSLETKLTTVMLEGEVSAMGHHTTYHFEYGPDASYGMSVPVSGGADAGNGSEFARVKQFAEGLQPGTTYHYRLTATNEYGTTYGPDASFMTLQPSPTGRQDSCPNAASRTFASANLPDCRAYELVSPVEKNGADIIGQQLNEFVSSVSGERVQFITHIQLPESTASGAGGFSQYIASRTPSQWVTKGIMPEVAPGTPYLPSNAVLAFTGNLDRAIVIGYELPGVSGGVPNADNFYLEDTSTGQLTEAITRNEGPNAINGFFFSRFVRAGGASSDLQVMTFESAYNLIPQATGSSPKLYVMDHGTIRLAGVLPDGSLPAEGSRRAWKSVIENQGEDPIDLAQSNTVSEDGSRILFMSPTEGSGQQLYLRKNETETVWVSRSEASSPISEPVNVRFQAATSDGRHVVFTADTPLLDSDPGGPGTGLYMYTDSPEPEAESNLTFIARVASVDHFPSREQVVSAVSSDGSYIYFASNANGSLPGSRAGGFFVWHEGNVTPVAQAPVAQEVFRVEIGSFASEGLREAEVTPDGKKFVFVGEGKFLPEPAILSLRGESKIGSATHYYGNAELYLYDADTNSLKCVSCPPSGDAVTHGAEVANVEIPGAPISFQVGSPQRYFTSDGKYVFFSTVEALLPQDTNGLTDAYEYNVQTGRLSLLSTGTGENPTWFVEASPNGRDVFLLTREKLKRQDPDNLADLYDARVEGGQPEPPPPGNACAGDSCQGTPSAIPSFASASEFVGSGNPPATTTTISASHRRALTRSERLKRALKVCQRKPKHERAKCSVKARKAYAVKKHGKRAGR